MSTKGNAPPAAETNAAVLAKQSDALKTLLGDINAGFSGMPYGGSCRFKYFVLHEHRAPIGVVDIAEALVAIRDNLRSLQESLEYTATRDHEKDAELERYRGMIGGLRALFAEVSRGN